MAQTGPQKGLFQRAIDRVKELYNAVDDRVVQWRKGRHAARRAEIINRVAELPGGAKLLRLAKEHGVKIFVVAPRRIEKAKGRFSRSPGKKVIRVANNGDVDLMTTTLWHELRHAEQHIHRGDMEGNTTRLKDTRAQHMLSLMHEADAFTMQALLALRQKKAGNPAYFDKLVKRPGPANIVIAEFTRDNPYEGGDGEAQFARGLFTEIMLRGMTGYSARYFDGYSETFTRIDTAESYRKLMAARKAPPDFGEDADDLTAVYGAKFTSSTSPRAIATAFLHSQPAEAYEALKLIEETAARAETLTEQEFQQARKEILTRTKSLSKAFNKAALKFPKDQFKLLREAAASSRPPVQDRKRGVRAA
jgi:hypothetical protein